MNPIFAAALEAQDLCRAKGWAFCFIGTVAVQRWGGREKDWLDIEGIVLRQAGRLDERLIWTELEPLLELKGAPEAATRLRAILGRG